MNIPRVVKILVHDDEKKAVKPKWHVVTLGGDTDRALCNGEAFDGGTSCKYLIKTADKRGMVTCQDCIDIVNHYNQIRL